MRSLAVIVGRFQVPRPHAGHTELIAYAQAKSDHVLLVVGHSPKMPDQRDPLSAHLREQLLAKLYPDCTVRRLQDCASDRVWSARLDALIATLLPKHVVLYGSRDSCLPYYQGAHARECVGAFPSREGTEIRRRITLSTDPRFLAGVIYAQRQRLPVSYQTIDVLIADAVQQRVLLGRKESDGDKWRLPGGFVDPVLDRSLEEAAIREAREEVGAIELGAPRYLGSRQIDDWRYRSSQDKILTALFHVPYLFGAPVAADDLDHVTWFPEAELEAVIHPVHRPLIDLWRTTCART